MLAVLLIAVAGCTAAPKVAIPDTAVGKQLQWYLDVVNRAPVDEGELTQHLSRGFLQDVPATDFNTLAKSLAGLKVDKLGDVGETRLTGQASVPEQAYQMEISVDGQGKIDYLLFNPK